MPPRKLNNYNCGVDRVREGYGRERKNARELNFSGSASGGEFFVQRFAIFFTVKIDQELPRCLSRS